MGERAEPGERCGPRATDAPWSRRRWLEGGALGLLAGLVPTLHAQEKKKAPLTPADEKVVAAVR